MRGPRRPRSVAQKQSCGHPRRATLLLAAPVFVLLKLAGSEGVVERGVRGLTVGLALVALREPDGEERVD